MRNLLSVQSNGVHIEQRNLETWIVMSEPNTLTMSRPRLSLHSHALFVQSLSASQDGADSHERITFNVTLKRSILNGFHKGRAGLAPSPVLGLPLCVISHLDHKFYLFLLSVKRYYGVPRGAWCDFDFDVSILELLAIFKDRALFVSRYELI